MYFIEPTFADFKEDWGEKGPSFLLTLDDCEDYGEKNNLIALIILAFSSSWCFCPFLTFVNGMDYLVLVVSDCFGHNGIEPNIDVWCRVQINISWFRRSEKRSIFNFLWCSFWCLVKKSQYQNIYNKKKKYFFLW